MTTVLPPIPPPKPQDVIEPRAERTQVERMPRESFEGSLAQAERRETPSRTATERDDARPVTNQDAPTEAAQPRSQQAGEPTSETTAASVSDEAANADTQTGSNSETDTTAESGGELSEGAQPIVNPLLTDLASAAPSDGAVEPAVVVPVAPVQPVAARVAQEVNPQSASATADRSSADSSTGSAASQSAAVQPAAPTELVVQPIAPPAEGVSAAAPAPAAQPATPQPGSAHLAPPSAESAVVQDATATSSTTTTTTGDSSADSGASSDKPSSGTPLPASPAPTASAFQPATATPTDSAVAPEVRIDGASLPRVAAEAPATTLASPTASSDAGDELNAARLTRGLQSALNQKGGAITLRLTPPQMGTVRIALQIDGATVSAQFHAETESARTLLTQQLGQLRTALEAQGLSVERLGVQQTSTNNNAQWQQGDTQHNDGRSRGQHAGRDAQQTDDETQQQARQQNAFDDLVTEELDAAA